MTVTETLQLSETLQPSEGEARPLQTEPRLSRATTFTELDPIDPKATGFWLATGGFRLALAFASNFDAPR